jgi:hypothetical protein
VKVFYYTLFVALLNLSGLVTVSEFQVTRAMISDFGILKSDFFVNVLLRIRSICKEVNTYILLYILKGKSCYPSIINHCWYHHHSRSHVEVCT